MPYMGCGDNFLLPPLTLVHNGVPGPPSWETVVLQPQTKPAVLSIGRIAYCVQGEKEPKVIESTSWPSL